MPDDHRPANNRPQGLVGMLRGVWKKSPDVEETAAETLGLFRRDIAFARAMSSPRTATVVLIGVLFAVFLSTALFAEWMARHLSFPIEISGVIVRVPPRMMAIWLGAKSNQAIEQGEVWRLGSSMLLHGGKLHLILNVWALYVLGNLLERLYGMRRFLVLFFLSGFAGSLASFLYVPTDSVGASGAIFGLLGAAVIFGLRHGRELPMRVRRALTIGLFPWVVFNITLGFTIEQIDNAAHIGGLVGGSFLALVLPTSLTRGSRPLETGLEWLFLVASLAFMAYSATEAVVNGVSCTETNEALAACIESLRGAR